MTYFKTIIIPQPGYDRVGPGPTGTLHSYRADGTQVPSVRGAQALDGAQMINTVLGVANLAVGIYNAYQGYKIRKEVGALRQELKLGLDNIQSVLNYQSQQLDCVLAAQLSGNEKLDRLILNVETGFHLLGQQVEGVTADRRGDELREKVTTLLNAQRSLARGLEGQLEPSDFEAVKTAAAGLRDYADSRLIDKHLPPEARQPLVLSRSAGCMALVDCRLLSDDSERSGNRAVREIEDVLSTLQDEAATLHQGATPWKVIRFVGVQASNYCELIHAIEQRKLDLQGKGRECGQTVRVFAPERPLSLLESDGRGDEEKALPLRTIDDYRWFTEISGSDPVTYDVHSRKQVARVELEQLLAAPQNTLELTECRRLAEPTLWKSYRDWTEKWMQMPVAVELGKMKESRMADNVPLWNTLTTARCLRLRLNTRRPEKIELTVNSETGGVGTATFPHASLACENATSWYTLPIPLRKVPEYCMRIEEGSFESRICLTIVGQPDTQAEFAFHRLPHTILISMQSSSPECVSITESYESSEEFRYMCSITEIVIKA
jgi:hypothetical protein